MVDGEYSRVTGVNNLITALERSIAPCRERRVRYGEVRCGTVRRSAVRYDTVRYGTVRRSAVRYGAVRYRAVRERASGAWPTVDHMHTRCVFEVHRCDGLFVGVLLPGRPMEQGWPATGAVKLEGIKMRYRPGLDLVLKGVSLDIKVCVCSSLVLSVLTG